MTMRSLQRIALYAVVALAPMAIACDVVEPSQSLTGGYRLTQFESQYYHLRYDWTLSGASGGVLGGDIQQLGWSERYIVASRRAPDGSSGWMVVDVRTHKVAGPFADNQWTQIVALNGDLKDIRIRPVQQVWDSK